MQRLETPQNHFPGWPGKYAFTLAQLCRYALMMQLAHDAIARHSAVPAMLYISIDQVWTSLNVWE
jgi:hypothetical protein